MRGWLRRLETAGIVERKGTERTGKPGRPPVLWGLTEKGARDAAGKPHLPSPLGRDEARRLLHQACREELGIGGRQFVRRLDAGYYECGWRCACTIPHHPGLRMLLRAAAWSHMSVVNASRPDPSAVRRNGIAAMGTKREAGR